MTEKELELKERELNLRERELNVREKELEQDELNFDKEVEGNKQYIKNLDINQEKLKKYKKKKRFKKFVITASIITAVVLISKSCDGRESNSDVELYNDNQHSRYSQSEFDTSEYYKIRVNFHNTELLNGEYDSIRLLNENGAPLNKTEVSNDDVVIYTDTNQFTVESYKTKLTYDASGFNFTKDDELVVDMDYQAGTLNVHVDKEVYKQKTK